MYKFVSKLNNLQIQKTFVFIKFLKRIHNHIRRLIIITYIYYLKWWWLTQNYFHLHFTTHCIFFVLLHTTNAMNVIHPSILCELTQMAQTTQQFITCITFSIFENVTMLWKKKILVYFYRLCIKLLIKIHSVVATMFIIIYYLMTCISKCSIIWKKKSENMRWKKKIFVWNSVSNFFGALLTSNVQYYTKFPEC